MYIVESENNHIDMLGLLDYIYKTIEVEVKDANPLFTQELYISKHWSYPTKDAMIMADTKKDLINSWLPISEQVKGLLQHQKEMGAIEKQDERYSL